MKIPNKLRKVSKLEPKNLKSRGLKLGEEYGELVTEILKYKGEKGSEKTADEILIDLKEEAVDCLIMSLDILVYTGCSDKYIAKILNKKLDKWMKNVSN
jgi:NTP pyrophosphatase (non-canonical NTP hydrolase)